MGPHPFQISDREGMKRKLIITAYTVTTWIIFVVIMFLLDTNKVGTAWSFVAGFAACAVFIPLTFLFASIPKPPTP